MGDPDYDRMSRDAEDGLFYPDPDGVILQGEEARRAAREMLEQAARDESPNDEGCSDRSASS